MKWLSSLGLVGIAAAQLAPTTPPKGTQPNNLPALGLGTWYMRGTNATAAVSQAIVDGYRLIDCAYIYFNQQQVGAGINDGIKRAGIRREDLWVTSKVWNNRYEQCNSQY
jgi:alcohol dehydrogenase (NADP+)